MRRDKSWYIQKAFSMCVAEAKGGPIQEPGEAYEVLRPYGLEDQEHFLAVFLDAQSFVIDVRIITKGLLSKCPIHPREVFAPAIVSRAHSLIIAHNHPSGKTAPSKEDIEATARLVKAGEILGIQVVDHLVLGLESYYSLRENGDMK